MSDHGEWLFQATRDLRVAEHLLSEETFYEWAAYAALQSAEKAAKALRLAFGASKPPGTGAEFMTHDVAALLYCLPDPAPRPDRASLSVLFAHNNAARYPGGRGRVPLAPGSTYTAAEATKAVEVARETLDYCTKLITCVDHLWETRQPPTPPSSH
jgi:HEPN domain-containing protein